DVTNHENLVDLMESHDLIVNTVGPFFRFEKMIIEAAIEAKKSFVDINDDWKPTLEALKLNDHAKTAGITGVIGIGASPGITNLLAVMAAKELDEVDELITAWGGGRIKYGIKPRYYIKGRELRAKWGKNFGDVNAAMVHLIYESLEKVPTFRSGKLVGIIPLIEAKPLKFSKNDERYAVHIGHPEPVTLYRQIKANSISNLMCTGKNYTENARKFRDKVANKELTVEEATTAMLQSLENTPGPFTPVKTDTEVYKPTLIAQAIGKKNGEKKKVGFGLLWEPYGGMAGNTGGPLAVAAMMLINGKIKEKGIFAPEGCIDPRAFFTKLAPYCGENLGIDDILVKNIEML
ncbi:MAG: saccharopine dehydrogenase family protein, partial [Promethearchaeota archaeon]